MLLLLPIGFMEIDKGKSINYSSVREEEDRWSPVTLGKPEEERGGNEASSQTGIKPPLNYMTN